LDNGSQLIPVKNQPVVEQLQQYMRNYIIAHDLKPGDLLPSSHELASGLNASVSSVREALRSLEMLGVVETRHGIGTFVRALNFDVLSKILSYSFDFDPSTVGQLLKIRQWLEVAAISEIAHVVDAQKIRELESILAEWERDIPSDDWGKHDRRFHNALNATLNNELLIIFLDMFWVAYDNSNQGVLKALPDPYETLDQHRAILQAVKSGNVDACHKAVLNSYRNIEERLNAATEQHRSNPEE
jgi:DNA-binding FadR family transcriptional regulator